MLTKLMLAAGLFAASFAGLAGTADAKTKIIIGIGQPGYCDDGYFWRDGRCRRSHRDDYNDGDGYDDGYYRDDNPGYGVYEPPRSSYRLSCRDVRRKLRNNGWRNVQAQDCEGRVYSFIARRHGDTYELRVNSRNGRVVSRNPL